MSTNEPLQVEISKTLQHILKNVAKKEVEMKNILNKALDVLKDYPLKDPEYETKQPTYDKDITALATPFVQCCDPQNKFVKQSLQVLQRLILSGFVRPSPPTTITVSSPATPLRAGSPREVKDATQSHQLIGIIIDKVCKCADADENIQALVVKFLQTCCTTPTCELHGATLLTAVKTCFQLFTQSRQTQLFASAKSAITNIINFQFHRIKTTKRFKRTSTYANINDILHPQQAATPMQNFPIPSPASPSSAFPSPLSSPVASPELTVVPFDKITDVSTSDKHRMVLEILNEIIDDVVNSGISIIAPEGEGMIVEDLTFSDFCMIFVLICQVSIDPVRSHREVHGKLLALQILHTILSKSSVTLRSSRKFVEILREHVMSALIGNANTNEKVFQYVLSIFLALLQFFREDLKEELGSFFVKFLLPRLETSAATQELYWMLSIFTSICKDPALLLDLYVNYDCDVEQENIFQRSIDALCKSARQPLVSQRFISSQYSSDFQIRSSGLKCIVQLTKSLASWKDSERGTQLFDTILQQKEHKAKIEHARIVFSESPRKGLELFVELGETKQSPAEIAKFLRNFRGLDKVKIGEYISKKENKELLASFAELFDFSNMEFDLALRHFLSSFRLPGESMLIERLMQQFADHFYASNKESQFANSDAAFVLAYSTILLATDQHNPNVKNKMTFAQWAKNNTKINDGKDFEESYLLAIFERIVKTPLKLNENVVSDDGPRKSAPFSTCYRQGVVKTMTQCCWANVVEVFDFFMQNSDDKVIIPMCLIGLQNAVHLAGVFELETVRAKFLESAIKFAKIDNVREVSRKEVDSIRSLAITALFDGKYLGSDWLKILQCISNLGQVYKLGNVYEITDPVMDANVLSTKQIEAMTLKDDRDPEHKSDVVIFDSSHIVSMMNQISINSTLLPEEQLVLFVEAICKVAYDEIFNFSTPNVFCLQNLVDVAYYNLCSRGPRGGAVWSRIWLIMSGLFIKIGLSEHSFMLRKTAIDSVEYLLRHFFTKDIEVQDTFYKDLFHPYDRIVRLCHDTGTRTLVLQYSAQLIGNNYKKIRGGWKTVFSIYTWAANCQQVLVETGLTTVEEILREYFQYFATLYFVQFVNCLGAFANSKFPHVSTRAIEGISSCAVHLANGRVVALTPREPVPRSKIVSSAELLLTSQMTFTDAQEHLVVWMPVLTALSDVLSSHDHNTVRLCALDTLERVLVLFGSMFSPRLWEMIFRGVIFPIFNNVGYSKGCIRFPEESHEWLSTTCPSAFRMLMGLFSTFLDTIEFLAAEIMQLIASCFLQSESEELLRLGAQSFLRFATNNGARFSDNLWELVSTKTAYIIEHIVAEQSKIEQDLMATPSLLPSISSGTPLVHSSSLPSMAPSHPSTLQQSPSGDNIKRSPSRTLSTSPIRGGLSRQNSVSLKQPAATSTDSADPLRKSVSFPRGRPATPTPQQSGQSPQSASTPDPNSNSPWAPRRKSTMDAVIAMPRRQTRSQSLVAALQLCVQIVESVALAHDAYPAMTAHHLRTLANALENAYVFCHSLVYAVLEEDPGYVSDSIEILDSTELLACMCYFKIMFVLDISKDVGNEEVERLLISRCYLFMSKYLKSERVNKRLIVQILQDFVTISDEQFVQHLGIFYNMLVQLMLDDSKKIRKALKPIWVRIGAKMGNRKERIAEEEEKAEENGVAAPAPVVVR